MFSSSSSKLFLFSLIFFVAIPPANAQEIAPKKYDLVYDLPFSGWMNSMNSSRLFEAPFDRTGYSALFFRSGKGMFHNYNDSGKQTEYGLTSEAYQRLSARTMLYGAAGYHARREKKQGGSAFLNPDEMPFDLIDFDDMSKSEKKLEQYRLTGAAAHRLTDRFSIGGKMEYNAMNYARTKDLRHKNTILDMDLSTGFSYRAASRFILGAHYRYRRYIEGILFNTYSNTDRQYKTLINFGAFYGKTEAFDQNGYTAKGEKNPYVDERHQVGIQLEYRLLPRMRLFNEIAFTSGNGYFGKRSSASIVYTEHTVKELENRFLAIYEDHSYTHQLELKAAMKRINNFENSWRSETTAAGNTIYQYYGQNEVGVKSFATLSSAYTITWGKSGYLPAWQLEAASHYESRTIRSVLYPYFREQHLSSFTGCFGMTRHCQNRLCQVSL
ncbi:MAG: hypothetical protein RR346_06305 [Bacteroidales bacterium]